MDDPRASIHSLVRREVAADRPLGHPFGQPVKAAPAHVTRKMHPEEAFRATLADCLAQLTANAATLRLGRSAEGLHQLRVAFRRLEVALGAFGQEFRQDWLEDLRSRAKILSGRLAPARDLDVFIGKLRQDGEGMDELRARAEDVRGQAWEAATATVTSADFARFLDDVAAVAQSQLPLARDRRLPRTASRMLARQAKRVDKRGRAAASRDEGDLHRLRIALKKLRYTAEFFAPLYPARKVKRYLKTVRALQQHLGDLNDVANVRGVVGSLLREAPAKTQADAELRFAAGLVLGACGAGTNRAAKQALKRYGKFRKLEPFWR